MSRLISMTVSVIVGSAVAPGPVRADPRLRCGYDCLYIALKTLGVEVGAEDLERRLGPPSKSGYALGQIQDAAESYGLQTLAVQTTLERLSWRQKPFCVIAHVDGEHFVNLIESEPGKVRLLDAPQSLEVSSQAFAQRWSGTALLLAKQPLAPEETLHGPSRWVGYAGWILLAVGGIGIAWGLLSRLHRGRPVLAVAAFCLWIGGCFNDDATEVGRIRIPVRELSLGEIPWQNTERTATLTIENVGTGVLLLKRVLTSCTCVIPTEIPGQLAPGASTTCQVKIRPLQGGPGDTSFTIVNSDPIDPVVTIKVRWDAVASISTEPATVDFGTTLRGAEAERELRLIRRTAECRFGEPSVFPPDVFSAELKTIETDAMLLVRVKSDLEAGTYQGTIRIPVEGCDAASLRIPVHCQIRDRLTVVPPRVALGTARPGEVIERTLSLFRTEEGDETPVSVVAEMEGMTAEMTSADKLRVRWEAPLAPGIHTGTVTVRSDSSSPASTTIPVSGTVKVDLLSPQTSDSASTEVGQ